MRDRVNRVLPLLPRTIEQPTVEKFDPDSAPVMTLAVSADKPIRDITEYADKTLRRQLESVSGVGQVVVVGGRARQINVTLDPGRLQRHNLTVTDVSRALQAQNAEIPGGRVEQGATSITLRTRGRVQSVAGVRRHRRRQQRGPPGPAARRRHVEDGMADATTRANVNGKPTVLLTDPPAVRHQHGADGRRGQGAARRHRAAHAARLQVRVVRDLSDFIRASIDTVEEHLVVGSILAALVVLVFLWNWRSTLIAAIAIPTSIIATFGLIWYQDFTLNSMTMLALTLAVGIVIDDAIVVLENIYRFVEEKGWPPIQAAVEATREIGLAVMATTLSLIAIFVPVGFMGGIVGRFMKSFGLTMSFAILVSLLVSFTLTPMLSARWIKMTARRMPSEKSRGSKDSRFFRPIDGGYSRRCSPGRWRTAASWPASRCWCCSAACRCSWSRTRTSCPNDDQSEFEVGLRAPEGTSIDATEIIANRIATRIRQLPEVDYTLVTIADDPAQTQNSGTVYVRLKPLEAAQARPVRGHGRRSAPTCCRSSRRPTCAPACGRSRRSAAAATRTPRSSSRSAARTSASWSSSPARWPTAAKKQPGVVDVDTSLNVGKPELSVQLDRLKAADLGVQIADAAEALRLLVGGDQVTTYNEGGEQYEVHVRAVAGDRQTAAGDRAADRASSSRSAACRSRTSRR